ncbi:hypothetical protein GCM10011533_03140 [Streptosporangium jomthongense]|uniref:DUF4124 domain-containing protein n=1 Tax=Marinobacter aromaticivorans TaxID=1494078 RepID=A0ABW2IQZ6_9GAMM|nr:DUF4124 domain-containing protein [Marinobacter aromaticivorans]GGE54014.1 hypothetical protein GCM10011533_03140 [Streptosporangium jomthongense]
MPGIVATAILILVFPPAAIADIYTWTDASGVVHFTDTPPRGKSHEPFEVADPVTLPMAENLRQHKRISDIRKQVKGMLATDGNSEAAHRKSKAKALAKQEKTCAGYREKLAGIQSQLRRGYGVDKGNSLRRKRRKLNRLLGRECILR